MYLGTHGYIYITINMWVYGGFQVSWMFGLMY